MATGATNGNRLMKIERGSVSGPSHHVDRPVLRELTQIAMNEATANSQVTNKNRLQATANWPARTVLAGNTKGIAAGNGGGGGGIAKGVAKGGAKEGAKEGEGAIGSIPQ